jgi:succinoglycan biosynthesis transport protein ExoP
MNVSRPVGLPELLGTDAVDVVVQATKPARVFRRRKVPAKTSGERTVARDASVFWRVVDSPFSMFAESIRLATHCYGKVSNRVIGFTSALPHEGKSTIAAAVAQLAAKVGGRVIIVDCDLRIPSLSRSLAPDATLGITDVISGARSLEETVWKDPVTNLFFCRR